MEDYLKVASTYLKSLPESAAIYESIINSPVALTFCLVILCVFSGVGVPPVWWTVMGLEILAPQ